MKLTDIIELAKQGYTPADIKELMNLNLESVEQQQEEAPEEVGESDQATQEEAPETVSADTIDYKKLYEESQIALKEAQNANTNKAISVDQENDFDILSKTIKGFM